MTKITRRSLLVGAAAIAGSRTAFSQTPIKLRFAHPHPEVDPVQTAALKMAELLKQRSNGQVEMQVFPNGVLGSDPTMVSAVRGGTIDMGWTGNPFFTGMAPRLNVLDLPFIFKDRAHVARVFDGPIGDELRRELEPSNLVTLATWEVGWRSITNSRRPVRTPADVKGLKIRTTPNPAHIKAFQLLGASPTPMAFTELYTAMETGTVDGQDNPALVVLSAKFYEVQKHLSETHHCYTVGPFVMNKPKFEGLPSDIKTLLSSTAKEMAKYQRQLRIEAEKSTFDELRKQGMQVIEEIDQQPFREIVYETVKKDYVDKYGPELVDKIAAAASA